MTEHVYIEVYIYRQPVAVRIMSCATRRRRLSLLACAAAGATRTVAEMSQELGGLATKLKGERAGSFLEEGKSNRGEGQNISKVSAVRFDCQT